MSRRRRAAPRSPVTFTPPSPEEIALREARNAEMAAAAAEAKAIYNRGPLAIGDALHDGPQARIDFITHFARSRTLFRIPCYQRESVWSAEQAHQYVSDVFCGNRPAGVFVLRERRVHSENNPHSVRVVDVLDGQQRLLAMGAPCFRGTVEDIANLRAEPVFGPAPWFDFEATDYADVWRAKPMDAQRDLSRLLDDNIEPGHRELPPINVPLFYLSHHAWRQAARKSVGRDARLEYRTVQASAAADRIRLLLVVLSPSMPLDVIRLWFRAINSGGAPMSAEDLERALAAAGD